MKKLFGISLVAVLAVSPLMAGATDLTSDQLAKANINNSTDLETVATVSYVKGAYGELGTAINTKQDKLSADQLSAIQNAANTDLSNLTNTGKANVSAAGTVDLTKNDYGTGTVGKALVDIKSTADAAAERNWVNGQLNAKQDIANSSVTETVANQHRSLTAGANVAGNLASVATVAETAETNIGTMNNLQTTEKGSLVGAINELNSGVANTYTKTEIDNKDTATLNSAKSYADGLAVNYATAAQGALADSAVQSVAEGLTNGTVSVDGTDVAVHGLGSAAFTDSTAYDAAGTAQNLITNLGIADYAKKTGVTATITSSTISGTVPVLATWGDSTATTAPISASITGAAYTETVAQGNN